MLLRLKIIWENLFLSLTSILRILFLSKYNLSLNGKTDNSDCVILGNGPSLNEFIKQNSDFLQDKSTVCVNYFVRSKTDYVSIKPNYYVITSPEYWEGEEKEGWQEDRLKTFQLIAQLTEWRLTLIVPKLAKNHKKWRMEIDRNQNISIQYFNNIPVEGFRNLRHWAYKNHLAMPRPHNVLIPSILMMINLSYKKIFIAGAEHSWLKELYVNDENRVFLSQKHFYESKKDHVKSVFSNGNARPMYVGGSTKERKLHEVLEKFYYTFRSYWELNEYAITREIEVFNLTEDSYIDAFTKYRL